MEKIEPICTGIFYISVRTGSDVFIMERSNMMISTRGRYALRMIIDLAENSSGGYIPMKEVAERQNLSLKYLEQILPVLRSNNLIRGIQGKGGGYKLCKAPDEYTVGEILRLTEGDLAPVSCLECGAEPCSHADNCRTIEMWKGYFKLTNDYFDNITIAQLMKNNKE